MKKRDVIIPIEGFNLIGSLFLPERQSPCPLVCICHGIPSGRPADLDDGGYPLMAESICREEGMAVFLFNFRGTGLSGGNLDLKGWTRDLKAVVDHAVIWPEVDASRISLLGFSGGAVVSIYVAAQDSRITSVAACACPMDFSLLMKDSQAESYVEHFRHIGVIRDNGFPPSVEEWFDGFRGLRPLDCIAGISPRPLLIVHGDADDVVAVDHAYTLYEAAGEPKGLVILSGGGHRLRQDERTLPAVIEWLDFIMDLGNGV